MQKQPSVQQPLARRERLLLVHKRLLAAVASLALVLTSAAQTAWAAGGPGACKINGVLVDPPLPSGVTNRWTFIANFDHPKTATDVVTCLVIKTPSSTTYDVGTHHCTVIALNNPTKKRFGAGTARFDGTAYLDCAINPTPPPLDPPNVWVDARVNIPTTAQTMTSTLLSGSDITFSVKNDPTCVWTLNSQYHNFAFAHSTISACATYAQIESHLTNGPNLEGRHKVDTNTYGPATGTGPFAFSTVFAFKIALPGEIYTLDWLLIDPDSVKCCGGI